MKPNILWLTYEDTSPQFVSCYGQTPVATTPHIDRLADEGVRFNQAYASAPVCSASRTAIITGVCNEATGLGHHRSKYPLPRHQIPGFPKYLQAAGYYTTNNVKTDYNIINEDDYIADAWDESSTTAHWRDRQPGQPFFSVFNYMHSHQSRTMTEQWHWYEENVLNALPEEERIPPEQVDVPPIYRDNPEMKKHLSRVYNSLKLADRRIGERLRELMEDGLLEDTIILCFADHGEGIPRGKCNGIGFGYRASFVLYFPDKYAHLSPWGVQTVTDELVSFEDLAPTVLSLTGCEIPEYMTGRAFLGDQRKTPPDYIYAARNRLDDTPDLCRSVMDGRFVYTRNFFPHLPVVKYQVYSDYGGIQRTIRRDYRDGKLNDVQAELLRPERPTEYLYNIQEDIWETNNLADDPAYRDDLSRLREAAFRHMYEMNDVMFIPETIMVDRAEDSTPYEKRHDRVYNPLEEMLGAADLVGGGADVLPRQLELLNHAKDCVRYWAAVGIFAERGYVKEQIANGTADDVLNKLRDALDDEAEVVRIEIAAALYDACEDEKAGKYIEQSLLSTEPLCSHQMVEKLLYMPDTGGAFSDVVEKAFTALNAAQGPMSRLKYAALQGLKIHRSLYAGIPLIRDEATANEQERQPVVQTNFVPGCAGND